jgi:hypothetical protein
MTRSISRENFGGFAPYRKRHEDSTVSRNGKDFMKKKLVVTGALICGLSQAVFAGAWDDRFEYSSDASKFAEEEFSVDFFGLWASRDRDDFDEDDTLGTGAGVNYFFVPYLGVSAETYVDEFDVPNHVDGSIVFRFPVDRYSFAPYAFAGGGRQFHDEPQWTAHVGGGVEFRLNPHTGLFTDVRGIFPDKSDDLTMVRFGVRLVF